jgi:pimeloyl-ACP methyl ester carboxylesterase
MRVALVLVVIATSALPAHGQVRGPAAIDRLNRRLAGTVVDYTHNTGHDHRLYSPILGMPRDLYVYLPPGYTPERSYSLIIYLHGAFGDEERFLNVRRLPYIEDLIVSGCIPPVIIACPDGTCCGNHKHNAYHSFFINGGVGRFEDHMIEEVIPFLMRTFSIRAERQAHALMGASAGGFGAMNLAIKHRDLFGSVASLAGGINLRYYNCDRNYLEDFDPETYRWQDHYDPKAIVGLYACGLIRVPVGTFLTPVFGTGPGVLERIARENPADLLFTTNLQPGELAMYVDYGSRDNINLDAQSASFAWLAQQKGLEVTVFCDPGARHSRKYITAAQKRAYTWLGQRILPPTNSPGSGAGD